MGVRRFGTTILLFPLTIATILLIVYARGKGLISPRGVGFALLAYCIVYLAAFMFIAMWRTNSHGEPIGYPIDESTRRHRLFRIRWLKALAVILIVALLNGLVRLSSFPLTPALVGITMNLLITTLIIRTIVRLQNSLT